MGITYSTVSSVLSQPTQPTTSIPEWNGFQVCGNILPDIALENLLASMPVDEILKLREVCKVWRDITLRRTFWKIVCERNGFDWEALSSTVRQSENSWIVFYAACKNRIFHRNFILNHSGHLQFNHWQKLQDYGDRIIVESPPCGIEPLPSDPKYSGEIDSAFVYSYDWGTLYQRVSLKDVGLTKEIMRTILPFQFVTKLMIGSRFDCGGCFCVVLSCMDKSGEPILNMFNMSDIVLPTGKNWIEVTCTLNVVKECKRFDDINYLAVLLCGRDTQYWAGHYGVKCSRIAMGKTYSTVSSVLSQPTTQPTMSIPEWNGFQVCGNILPDIALENLLASVPVDEILKLREVCQVWRDIILRRTFWKIVCERNGIDWEALSSTVRQSEKSWIIFYAACKNRIFHRNFILNHSGHLQFNHWQKLQDNGDRIIVESPPSGIEPLPSDPKYSGEIDSAFVFSYDWGALQQRVSLKDVGLTKEIMRTIMPFQLVAKLMIGSRFDCGGCICVVLCFLDKRGESILFNMSDIIVPAGENWIETTCTLNVVEEFERFDDIKYMAILLCGKDTQYWAGHYGVKCSRIAVNLKCLSQIEAESVQPHSKYVTNPQNAHVFIGNFWRTLLPNRSVGRCPYSRAPRN